MQCNVMQWMQIDPVEIEKRIVPYGIDLRFISLL
jgi:hypothetical protein